MTEHKSSKKLSGPSKRFLEALDWVRDNMGLNQARIAELIGVHPSTISMIRSGSTSQPQNATIHGLKQFNVNPAWVLTGVGKMLLDDVSPPQAVKTADVAYDPAEDREMLLQMIRLANQLHDSLRLQLAEKDAEIDVLKAELRALQRKLEEQSPKEGEGTTPAASALLGVMRREATRPAEPQPARSPRQASRERQDKGRGS